MKKPGKLKKIWVEVVLLAVIAGIVIALYSLNAHPSQTQDRVVYSFPNSEVEQISIVTQDREMLFVKKQGEWQMLKPQVYKLDVSSVNRLENRLKDFLASRIMEENAQDLALYGLDRPQAIVSFVLNDGSENTLLIGDLTASKVQYYAKDTKRSKIFILGSYDVESLLSPVNDFRDRNVLSADLNSIQSISMSQDGVSSFRLMKDVVSDEWQIAEPLIMSARGDAVVEMMDNLKKLKIKDFITDQATDLSQYGLDSPSYTLEIEDANQQKDVVSFGKIDEEKQFVYISYGDDRAVYTVSLEDFDPQRFKVSNFFDEAPLSVSIDDIAQVTIIENGSSVVFIKDFANADVFTYSGNVVDQEDFTTLYTNIMALAAEGYDPDIKSGEPDLTVILETMDHNQIKAEFVQRDDTTYFMVLNEEQKPFYISERKESLIKFWRDRLLGLN